MRALLVDDQQAVRTALAVLLELHDVECLEAASPEEAISMVRQEDVGVVIQDMNFSMGTTSGEEGIELFRKLHELNPSLPIILLTAWSHLETAVALVKEGAADYIAKPWDDQKLVLCVKNLLKLSEASLEATRLGKQVDRERRELGERYDLCGLVYESRTMHDVVSLAVRVAPSDAAVFIAGPNGAGKEKLAEIVQANSRRRDKPFVRVNAGGLPDDLLEAELFGAEAGAYTGATKVRVGRFEAAHGGTLFLDELGNLSASGQMKLLRVLQTGEFQRLGSSQTRRSDVRLISATNADLQGEIAAGRFREDLYFRLNVIELHIPPLAERAEDLRALAEHFLRKYATDQPVALSKAAVGRMAEHDWPGNVRELENRIHRAVLVCGEGPITAEHLGLDAEPHKASPSQPPAHVPAAVKATQHAPSATSEPGKAQTPLETAERAVVEAALERANGVVSRAAAELGLSRQALYRRMERLGIAVERRIR